MVKVVEKSLEERAREEKKKTLIGITKELLGENAIAVDYENIFGFHVNKKIFVTIFQDNINVPEEKYFETAIKLAEAYEKATGSEWIVKKDY